NGAPLAGLRSVVDPVATARGSDTSPFPQTKANQRTLRSFAHRRAPARSAYKFLQSVQLLLLPNSQCLLTFNQFSLLLNLCLLLFESVDENGRELIVLDAFDLTLRIAEREQRLDLLNLLSSQTNVVRPVLFPLE